MAGPCTFILMDTPNRIFERDPEPMASFIRDLRLGLANLIIENVYVPVGYQFWLAFPKPFYQRTVTSALA